MHATLVHYAAVGVLLCLANVLLGAAAGHANEPAKVTPTRRLPAQDCGSLLHCNCRLPASWSALTAQRRRGTAGSGNADGGMCLPSHSLPSPRLREPPGQPIPIMPVLCVVFSEFPIHRRFPCLSQPARGHL